MEAEANSVPTQTTTILSGCASPIATSEYVATFSEELTPSGFAVLVIPTAILTYINPIRSSNFPTN
jgi:hypothetical protein